MGLFTFSSSSSPRRASFLRLPSTPIDDDVPFIESSQAIDVHRFERKLNILLFTTGLLSMAIIAVFVLMMLLLLSRDAWLKHSTTMVSVLICILGVFLGQIDC